MENIIAARRLRKSYIKDARNQNLEILSNISNLGNVKTKYNHPNLKTSVDVDDDDKEEKFKIKFKYKIIIKVFCATFIIFLCLLFKLVFPNIINENKYISSISNQYLKDYSKEDILNFIEDKSRLINENLKFLLPDSVVNIVKSNYKEKLKPVFLSFDLKNTISELLKKNETINQENENTQESTNEQNQQSNQEIINEKADNTEVGVGGGEPIEEVIKEDSSSVSIMDEDIKEIIDKKINIIKPVSGVITSGYGSREQIFAGVNPYHTGIDIANKLDTEIKSATTGIVKNTVKNDKYYGNYIEIETNGVTFKYGHLNSIGVNENQQVNQGDVIGKMGSTGMSTGSHLHFEIRINNRSVDPAKILTF